MGLETGTRIQDLVPTNPAGATDFVSQGDDHIRLIKACLQGSFPSLGATAVAVAAEKINFLSGVSSELQAQLDNKQPLDNDLTAIAALTTTSFGRAVLALADAAAARAHIGAQADDVDLTAIAALTTTSFGRDFLTLANLAALATKIAALAPTWSGDHVFNAILRGVKADACYEAWNDGTPTNAARFGMASAALGDYASGRGAIDWYSAGTGWLAVLRIYAGNILYGDSGGSHTHTFRGDVQIGSQPVAYRNLQQRTFSSNDNTAASDNGKQVAYTGSGGHTFSLDTDLPNGGVVIINNSGGGNLTISSGAGLYWFNGGGSIPNANRTLAIGGIATVRHDAGGVYTIWGIGLS